MRRATRISSCARAVSKSPVMNFSAGTSRRPRGPATRATAPRRVRALGQSPAGPSRPAAGAGEGGEGAEEGEGARPVGGGVGVHEAAADGAAVADGAVGDVAG